MNPVVPYLTPTPLQGEPAAKNGRSTDLGFATLLDGLGSSQERVAYDVRDTDNRSADRDSPRPRETDRAREDQNVRETDSNPRATRASDQADGAKSTAANSDTDQTNSKSTAANDTPPGLADVESDGSAPSDGSLKTSETPIEAGTGATSTAAPKEMPITTDVITAFDQQDGVGVPELQQALAAVTLAPTAGKAVPTNDAGASTAGSLPGQSQAPVPLLNQAAAASQNKSDTATAPSASEGGAARTGVSPAGSKVPEALAEVPTHLSKGASGPATPETSSQRTTQVQGQILAPNTPTQVAPSQSIAAQIAGITAEEKTQIKVTTDAQNGISKSLVSPGLLTLANTQANNSGANRGSANSGLTNGSAAGGNTTSADVLLNAQVAAQKEISGAFAQASAAKTPVGASPTATSSPAGPAEVLPPVGSAGLTNSGALPTSQVATAPAAKAGTPTASAAEQLGVQLTRAAQSGATRFTIQLQPAELGRVDVKMEITHDGKIHAVVTADRQDTLDMLQRDARGLERALQNSGLKADSNSLSFSLRDQGGSSGTFAESGNSGPGTPLLENDETTIPADVAALANQASGLGGADGRLNILV